jgi:ferredoxin
MSKVLVVPDQALVDPVTIYPDTCTGCNLCIHVCPVDLFLPNPRRGGPPLVLYPGECWFEGRVPGAGSHRAQSARGHSREPEASAPVPEARGARANARR